MATLVKYQKQVPVVVIPREECPYQGLKAFEEGQKQFFFGRERVVNQIQQKLNQKPFVPIIGASDSGKSSVVLAGLIPLLKTNESRLGLSFLNRFSSLKSRADSF